MGMKYWEMRMENPVGGRLRVFRRESRLNSSLSRFVPEDQKIDPDEMIGRACSKFLPPFRHISRDRTMKCGSVASQ
jgi:hypothetical protein